MIIAANVHPKMKFATSPTPAVIDPFVTRCTRIFTSSISTPAIGPIANEPTSSGISLTYKIYNFL